MVNQELTDRLATGLRNILPAAREEMESLYHVAKRDGSEEAEQSAKELQEKIESAETALEDYDRLL